MARRNITLAVLCAVALAPALSGCVGVAVVGGMAAAGGAGYEVGQERGINGTYSDFTTKTAILGSLHNDYGEINVNVYQGRVLLTGTTPTPGQKAQAEQAARGTPGVGAVYNEIEVGAAPQPWETAQDGWISTRVRSELMLDPDVRSPNYTIETDRQAVYLLGSARSQSELDRATQLARFVPGVQRVVSYVDIRTGLANGAPPPGPSQASAPPPTGGTSGYYTTPSSPSNAPIQVQKL